MKIPRQFPLPLVFASGVALTFGLTMAGFYRLMHPPVQDIALLAVFLSITASVSVVAGHSAYRLKWMNRLPRLSWALLAGYVLSSALTLLNVGMTAWLMFVNQHDLLLATVLLFFAGGIGVSLGHFFSVSLTDRLASLNQAASEIAQGHLDARVQVSGQDEISDLAHTFNDMAAQLERAEQQQRELDQLRRDLVAWIGHDLRTPLAAVRVIVEALADGVVEDEATVERYLETAQRHLGSLSSLLDDLFDMAQIDAGGLRLDLQPGSLCDLISDTIEAFSALAERQGVLLEGSASPDVDPVLMDVQKIGRVLGNLLDNALRHTPAGGAVYVSTVARPQEVQVQVRDTGQGISAEDLPRVFERFYRGEKSRSRETGGAGLGLAIAAGIVEAHGGQIDVQSQVGQGTRVWFTLPGLPAARQNSPRG
jgi:signal transduction histidine kinase